MEDIKQIIENAWENRELLKSSETHAAIRSVIDQIDAGTLRSAEPTASGWQVNEWLKKAVMR